jgi:DegV family protein with EDD domain
MIKTGIVTDSHSGIGKAEADELNIRVLSMPFYFDDVCYYENVTMNHDEFYAKLKGGSDAKTSQPSIDSIKKIWDEALGEFDEIVYIPISSGLSGACMTAMALSGDDKYAGKVFVVDNGRVSTPMHRSVLDAVELVGKGYSAAKVKEILEKNREKMIIYVAVDSLEYLKRGGRISTSAAVLGNLLNIKPILKFDVGLLDVYKKARGFNKAKKEMIDAMKTEFKTRFKTEYEQGRLHLLAASSSSEEDTASWIDEIKENFPGMEVMCDNLSFGVACHIGPGGLGIGCSCVPVE